MKLYQHPFSPNCQKVVALAHEVGTPLELAPVEIFKGESRAPAMLAKNPNGKVPILEDGDFVLWESRAMLTYIAAKAGRVDLAPTTPRERAEVDRWTAWQGAHFGPAIRKVAFERIVKKLVGRGAPDEAVVKAGMEEFAVTAGVLEQSLGTRSTCAAGSRSPTSISRLTPPSPRAAGSTSGPTRRPRRGSGACSRATA